MTLVLKQMYRRIKPNILYMLLLKSNPKKASSRRKIDFWHIFYVNISFKGQQLMFEKRKIWQKELRSIVYIVMVQNSFHAA